MPTSLRNVIIPEVAADPASPVDGELWIAQDSALLAHRVDGFTVPGRPAASWAIIGAGWYQAHGQGALNTQALTVNRAYATPFVVPKKTTLTDVAIEVSTLAATGIGRLGLYDALSTFKPGALMVDMGTVAAATTGVKRPTAFTAQTLWPGRVYFAVLTCTVAAFTVRSRSYRDPICYETATTPVLNANRTCYHSDTGFSGVLPASFGATIDPPTLGPLIELRFSG